MLLYFGESRTAMDATPQTPVVEGGPAERGEPLYWFPGPGGKGWYPLP
jgi:hypothetical protein